MTEREQMLAAIRSAPGDDTVRLAFADWLGEHGSGDRDAATAEFVRLSCARPLTRSRAMPPAAYEWLRGNWHRLVPSVAASPRLAAIAPKWEGRSVVFPWVVPCDFLWAEPGSVRTTYPRLEFLRGFASRVWVGTLSGRETLLPLVAQDQPFAVDEVARSGRAPVRSPQDELLRKIVAAGLGYAGPPTFVPAAPENA